MTTCMASQSNLSDRPRYRRQPDRGRLVRAIAIVSGAGLIAAFAGCQTAVQPPQPSDVAASVAPAPQPEALTIREGDVLKIEFPGTQNLDTTQQVRRDGKITLTLIGEVQAAGMKPTDLEKELVKLYSTQLLSKEVTVTVVSSSFAVYVTGAVMHPGKIQSDRPISALEAIMEAGGFDNTKADLKAVVVIRQGTDGRTKNYTVDLKSVIDGTENEPFYLKASDVVYVPEKFSWF